MRTHERTGPRDTRAGSILVLAVWVLLILGVLSVAVGAAVSASLQTARFLRDESIAWCAARAGVESAEAVLAGASNAQAAAETAQPGNAWSDVKVGEGLFTVVHLEPGEEGAVSTNSGIGIEESKVNLNFATNEVGRQLVRSLLETAGMLQFDDADAVASCIADWVDPDDVPRANGAESAAYRTYTAGYSCHNGPMDDIHELTLVKGVTDDLFRKVAPFVTVCGIDGAVNLNLAGRLVLASMARARPGVDPDVARALVLRIIDFREGGNVFSSADKREVMRQLFPGEAPGIDEQAEWAVLEWLLNHRMVTVQSRYFCGISIGVLSRGSVAGRRIAFVYDSRDDEIKAWNEY